MTFTTCVWHVVKEMFEFDELTDLSINELGIVNFFLVKIL